VGGPLRIPGVYSGTDRTFFFINYEGLRQNSASVFTGTMPLPEWRRGDFSNLKNAAGQPIIIYDPVTTRCGAFNPDGSCKTFTRDPISPSNVIPEGRISPIARNLMQYWPMPNTTPTNVYTQANNYTASGAAINNSNQIDSRVDHNFSA